jgi:hypothetical protein
MPNIVQLGSTMQCPHGATVLQIPSQTRIMLSQQPALLATDATSVVGCPFNISGSPHPCLQVQWSATSTKVQVNQQPVILENSVGLCLAPDGAPQGTVLISGVQTKVSAQ